MKALTVTPGKRGSARLTEVPEPSAGEGAVLAELVAMGICGTDREIVEGDYGTAPPGSPYLILGHESLGRVLECPEGHGLSRGDLIVGIVRRPDPVPCPNCAVGEWDMCRNGKYTERGIRALHGYGSERFRVEPEFAIRIDSSLGELGVLLEPASVVAKAWEHTEAIGRRATFLPRRALITGAGPIGLLAFLMARQRGYETHVLDRATEGPKPELVRRLDGIYHATLSDLPTGFDVVIECTGSPSLVVEVTRLAGADSVVCLTGVSPCGRCQAIDVGRLNRNMVLENQVLFGSVNANRRHYQRAEHALLEADRGWLSALITRRLRLADWHEGMEPSADDIKTILVA